MLLKVFETALSVCKVTDLSQVDPARELTFTGVTDEEVSLVCPTDAVPSNAYEREDGWRAFRIEGTLDFSLVGILADVSGALARANIGLFAISTYNTDYILVKNRDLPAALDALSAAGYDIMNVKE